MPRLRYLFAVPLLTLLLWFRPAAAEEPDADPAPRGPEVREISEQGLAAIQKGLAWLAAKQQEDGSWTASVGYKLNNGYVVTAANTGHPGVTALAGMAFLAGGNIPGRGKYGRNVEAAVRYVLSCVTSDGMISDHGTRMYSHAFATLFLAEVYGMTRDAEVKNALEKATAFTWKCQNESGSWRYAPYAQDSDMSITVCQVMALRSARNIGIRVPKESIDRAVNYVLMSANTDPRDELNYGSFKYQYRNEDAIPTRNSFALAAAGLATLYSAGLYTDQDIVEHIRKHKLTRFIRGEPAPQIRAMTQYIRSTYGTTPRRHYFYFYGNYYAVQAMFIAGGDAWDRYFTTVQYDLVNSQEADGSWAIERVGEAFSTSAACLILQIPYRYLPIFQR
jgi:prenyltransferase beta subunit